MQEFKFIEGPWTEFFSGIVFEHQIKIYKNQDSKMIVLISDKDGTGAIVEVYDFLYAEGMVESFVSSLPKTVITFSKHDKGSTLTFIVAPSLPAYSSYIELEDVVREQLTKTEITKQNILEVSKAYGVPLLPLSESGKDIREVFFTQSLLVPILSTAKQTERGLSSLKSYNDIFLGINKKQEEIHEPLTFFKKTLLSGFDFRGRVHFMHIFAESISLVKLPVIIFDFEDDFLGLKEQTDNLKELKKGKLNLDPISFPVRIYELKKDLRANISFLDAESFLFAHGVQSKEMSVFLQSVFSLAPENFNDLVKKIESISDNKVKPYLKERLVRVINVISENSFSFYGGANNIQQLTESKFKGLGSIHIIKTQKQEKENIFFLYSLLNELKEYIRENNRSGFLIIPKLHRFIGLPPFSEFDEKIIQELKQLSELGFGIIVDDDNLSIMPESLRSFETVLSIIRGRDATISFKGKRSYRLYVRPSMSKSKLDYSV